MTTTEWPRECAAMVVSALVLGCVILVVAGCVWTARRYRRAHEAASWQRASARLLTYAAPAEDRDAA